MISTETAPARGTQNIAGGALLIAFAGFALWAMGDLDSGSLRVIGPGGLPRAMAYGIGALGLLVLVGGLIRRGGEDVEPFALRGVLVVLAAILVFAVTIRPFSIGGVTVPGLGLIGAGPLAILVAGFAERTPRWLDLCILAAALTAGCMLLFGYLLNLPIPSFPVALLRLFPGWPQHQVLLLIAGGLLAVAAALWAIRRRVA